jgi:hypothetical protein
VDAALCHGRKGNLRESLSELDGSRRLIAPEVARALFGKDRCKEFAMFSQKEHGNTFVSGVADIPRVLLFSQREIYEPEAWRSSFYEFEEIIRKIDAVDLVSAKPEKWFKQGKRVALKVGRHAKLALNPGVSKVRVEKCYDLFVAICDIPSELLNVYAAIDWKECCRKSVCVLNELWVSELPFYTSCLEVLSKFDYVLVSCRQSVEPISKAIGKECSYLPLGVDAILFCPISNHSPRCIDILSYGRRSEEWHQIFLSLSHDEGLFYIYDTLKDVRTYDLIQHRLLRASLIKRSKYCVVNPGKFDLPEESGGQSEIGARYYEGAAGGTIMIGEEPKISEFKMLFNWPDAVVKLPRDYTRGEVSLLLKELSGQTERLEAIRNNNVVHSLLHHDWLYRWEAILKLVGLDPQAPLLGRKDNLKNLARLM